MKVILTGVTGMVGEGVLLECLDNAAVASVLAVTRRPYEKHHPKLKQLVVHDFMDLAAVTGELVGYDACFYCAGVSSVGLTEAEYTKVTYDTVLHFAKTLSELNPQMAFCHISGASTDGTEKGRIMWARVKGKAENALMRLAFPKVYNFRPGFMKPTPGQRNVPRILGALGALYPALNFVVRNHVSTMRDVALAMIHCAQHGYAKQVLEVPDIKAAARAG